jgi:hypothetical protein
VIGKQFSMELPTQTDPTQNRYRPVGNEEILCVLWKASESGISSKKNLCSQLGKGGSYVYGWERGWCLSWWLFGIIERWKKEMILKMSFEMWWNCVWSLRGLKEGWGG